MNRSKILMCKWNVFLLNVNNDKGFNIFNRPREERKRKHKHLFITCFYYGRLTQKSVFTLVLFFLFVLLLFFQKLIVSNYLLVLYFTTMILSSVYYSIIDEIYSLNKINVKSNLMKMPHGMLLVGSKMIFVVVVFPSDKC